MTELKILTAEQMLKIYPFGRDQLYALLNTKGCPVLPRKPHAPYQVIQSEFEEWLCNQKVK